MYLVLRNVKYYQYYQCFSEYCDLPWNFFDTFTSWWYVTGQGKNGAGTEDTIHHPASTTTDYRSTSCHSWLVSPRVSVCNIGHQHLFPHKITQRKIPQWWYPLSGGPHPLLTDQCFCQFLPILLPIEERLRAPRHRHLSETWDTVITPSNIIILLARSRSVSWTVSNESPRLLSPAVTNTTGQQRPAETRSYFYYWVDNFYEEWPEVNIQGVPQYRTHFSFAYLSVYIHSKCKSWESIEKFRKFATW